MHKEGDDRYDQILITCLEKWLPLASKEKLLEGFMLAPKLWPIFGAFACYRLMKSVDLNSFKSYYANNHNRLANSFREYIKALAG